uniref:Cysteine dioxygenase n=1 Tax=Plectus sambesii TaxID=2011161 RepID=A0A914V5B6_9BILA
MEPLCDRLRTIFGDDRVNVDEVEHVLSQYKSNEADWAKYAMFDDHKYTRNLVDKGNGKYNLMILCWGPGMGSSIHDHTDSHCFVKILQGTLLETRYEWPEAKPDEDASEEGRPMAEIGRTSYEMNGVTYMNDTIGLHRMENPSHTEGTVSLHLYIPAFDHCQMFDARTGRRSTCQVTFWSEFGEKIDVRQKIEERKKQKQVVVQPSLTS